MKKTRNAAYMTTLILVVSACHDPSARDKSTKVSSNCSHVCQNHVNPSSCRTMCASISVDTMNLGGDDVKLARAMVDSLIPTLDKQCGSTTDLHLPDECCLALWSTSAFFCVAERDKQGKVLRRALSPYGYVVQQFAGRLCSSEQDNGDNRIVKISIDGCQ